MTQTPHPSPAKPSHIIDLFTLEALDAEIEMAMATSSNPYNEYGIPDQNENAIRLSLLQRLRNDPRGSKRRLNEATTTTLDQINELESVHPHFQTVITIVRTAINLSLKTKTPISLPPILIVGSEGVGKTHFARGLGTALAAPAQYFQMNTLSSPASLTGLQTSWKGAKAGKLAMSLLHNDVANQFFVCDEFDKIPQQSQSSPIVDIFHSLLENENAQNFVDEYLDFPIRADCINWIITANQVDDLKPSLLDRMIVVEIPKMTGEQRRAVISRLYAKINKTKCANYFEDRPTNDLIDQIAIDPRKASQCLSIAFGLAAAEDRRRLSKADALAAEAIILNAHRKSRTPMGFRASL